MSGTLVDLFAGCGGMSLGLERAGFRSIFVNELSDDARTTYVQNQPPESDVRLESNQSSDIHELTRDPDDLAQLAQRLRTRADGDVDIVAGGPPCQGFSSIGHRRSFTVDKVEVPTNHLYREMATVVEAIAPKVFIFENVQGLMTSRWTPGGSIGEIWADVQAEFKRIVARRGRREYEYSIRPHLVHAKEFGVPQNRPRVIMVGVRADVAEAASYSGEWLPSKGRPVPTPPDPIDLLDDLVDPLWRPGGSTSVYPKLPQSDAQILLRTYRDKSPMPTSAPLLEHEYSRHSERVQIRFQHLRRGLPVPAELVTRKFHQRVIPERWPESGPNITVASLPDDFVHYAQDRSLTVREWARFQGFPDWYRFAGPRTTGGRRRAGDPDAGRWVRNLPKYTQIGNAVPVPLAEGIGIQLNNLLGLTE